MHKLILILEKDTLSPSGGCSGSNPPQRKATSHSSLLIATHTVFLFTTSITHVLVVDVVDVAVLSLSPVLYLTMLIFHNPLVMFYFQF